MIDSAVFLKGVFFGGLTLFSCYAKAGVGIAGEGMDMKIFCGEKPMVVGLADGYGGTTWRRTAFAEFRDELSQCKNVTRILYKSADGDAKKADSDIEDMVRQGVNALVVFPDFGTAQLPAMRKAMAAGVQVVPYLARVRGEPGSDYTANVYEDSFLVGYAWAHWFGKNLRSGNVVFLGGTAGAESSQGFFNGFKSQVEKFPGLRLVEPDFVVTNWSPADTQIAVEKLLAKHGRIDGVATDFGVTALAALRVFERRNTSLPAIATMASNNEISCKYLAMKNSGRSFGYYSFDGTTSMVRFAVRRAVAAFQGIPNPEPLTILPFLYADSASRVDPRCLEGVPADADLSSKLGRDKLMQVFK